MRSKKEILTELKSHTQYLDPQHSHLASIAMIETEIWIDTRDLLNERLLAIDRRIHEQTEVSKEIIKDAALTILLEKQKALNNL